MVARKRDVVAAALARTKGSRNPLRLLALVGEPEIAPLASVTLGAAAAGAPVVLDGLAASLPGVIGKFVGHFDPVVTRRVYVEGLERQGDELPEFVLGGTSSYARR